MIQMHSKKDKTNTKRDAAHAKKTSKKLKVQIDATETEQTSSIEDFNNTVDNSFFYTNDKRINAIDESEIISRMLIQYPDFNQQNKDTQLKKLFLQMLDDDVFILDILDYFNLTIYDFFKIIYKNYSSLFNALFIKKVKEKLQNCKYVRKHMH